MLPSIAENDETTKPRRCDYPLFPGISNSMESYPYFIQGLTLQLQKRHNLQALPAEICSHIASFLPRFPLNAHAAYHCRNCTITDQTCKSCHLNCTAGARSSQPLPHLKFFKIRYTGYCIGIGITTNPHGMSGIRFHKESCGFYLNTKCFYNTDKFSGNEKVTEIHEWFLRTKFENTGNYMALAIDYKENQILLRWPNRTEVLRMELPDQFKKCLLFPLVQAWDGCEASVVSATENEKEVHVEDSVDIRASLLKGSREDSWYKKWVELCNENCPLPATNSKTHATPFFRSRFDPKKILPWSRGTGRTDEFALPVWDTGTILRTASADSKNNLSRF